MNSMMPYGMMSGFSLLWIMIGLLLGLFLMVAVIWQVAHWRDQPMHHQRKDVPQSPNTSHLYEQGYQLPEPEVQAYQEGGYASPSQPQYEQPMVQYPQEMPLQR